MKKEDITNSDMMRILVRILYEEYREIQNKLEDLASKIIPEFKKKKTDFSYKNKILLDVAKNDLRMDVGIENPIYLRGYLIVPELLLHEKFICGIAKFENMETINNNYGDLFEFFKKFHKDGATVIGEDGISYGHQIDNTVMYAQKILKGKNIEDILAMYMTDISVIGTRLQTSISASVLLNNQEKLEREHKVALKTVRKLNDYKRETMFYDGNIYCKRQTITNDTFTAPINIFSKNEISCAEFFLQKVDDCSWGLVKKYESKKNRIKKEYLFDKGVVGVLRINYCDKTKNVAFVAEEYLIKPAEIGINQDR